MTPQEREKILKVVGDHSPNLQKIHYLRVHFKKHNEILDWCIKNNLTGKAFEAYWVHECNNSPLRFGIRAIQGVDKTRPTDAPLTQKELIL